MTPEVKERIEQIRQGIVPEGYKKTSSGIFPCEWDIQPLRRLLEFKNGINADKEKFGKGIKLISVRDILADEPISYASIRGAVEVSAQQLEEFAVNYGDVLFQRSSENYEDAGTSNVYLDPDNTAVFSGFVIRGKKISDYNPVYLNALLRSFYVRKAIVSKAAGAQHINVGQESLAKICVALADNIEQQEIAKILTAQDKVIELKEKLLAEKQRQKKYLMQQLLTGKKRLPGFNGEWNSVKIADICTINARNEAIADQIVTFLGMSDVSEDGKILNQRLIACSDVGGGFSSFRRGDVLVAKITPCFENGKGAYADDMQTEYGFGSTEFHVLRGQGMINSKYLFYHTQTDLFRRKLEKEMTGSAGQKRVQTDSILRYEFILPTLTEQNAIVNVLTTGDKEIELLQEDIKWEKQKKKALMQLLLTGIVRVNV